MVLVDEEELVYYRLPGKQWVKFSTLHAYSPGRDSMNVDVIKSFVCKGECKYQSGRLYANAFLCRDGGSGDSLLVFVICPKPGEV